MALYVTTAAVSVLVTATGLALLAIQSTERQLQDNLVCETRARWCARSGQELARLLMENAPDWRVTIDDWPGAGLSVGASPDEVCRLSALDNPLRLIATGECRGMLHRFRTDLTSVPRRRSSGSYGHVALSYAIFSASTVELKSKAVICGPVRAHGNITATADVVNADDRSYETLSGYSISSNLSPQSFSSTTIALPAPSIASYRDVATRFTGPSGSTCILTGLILQAGYNNYGADDANGIYALDAGGRAVEIRGCSIEATLIIYNTAGKTITFKNTCLIEPTYSNMPTLLIESASSLSIEADASSWFEGVLWAGNTSVTCKNAAWRFEGSLIAASVKIEQGVIVDNAWYLTTYTLPGFANETTGPTAGSVREVADVE